VQHITIKHNENNFFSWKQQVEGIIRTHMLYRHVVNSIIPSRYLTEANCDLNAENSAYTAWDKML
jgi:hypothetical protein